ncbi:hypothetical protein EON65_24160 [archaeon]|nr:MAG: hypothetical protein EON65_24160 [archaeon]
MISKNSQVTGDIQFNFLLRIDGNATGRIIAPLDANLVISRSGTYRGDIRGLGSVFIDGKIHGNIYALRLFLGPHAAVRGDIHCQRFSCSGTASVVGRLHINPNAPINTSFACTHLVKEDMLLTPLKPSKQPFSNQNDDSVTNDRPDGLFALDQLHEEGRVYQLDDMSQTPRAHTPSELQAQSPKPPQPEETQASGTVEVDQGNGGAEGAGDGEAQGDEEHSSSSADEVTTVPNEPADDKMEKQSDSNVSHGTTEQMDLHVTDAPEQEAELGAEDEPPHEAELGVEETQAGNIVEGAAEIDSPPPITSPEPKEEVTGNIGEATEGNAGQTEEKTSSPTTDQTDSDVHAEKQPDDMETSEEVQDNADVSKVEEEVQSKEPNSQPTDEASTLQTNDAANNPSDLADSSPQDTDPTSESSVAPTDTTTESAQDAPDAPTASDQPKVNETDDATAPPVADRRHNWLLIVEPQMDFYTGGQWCCASSASSALFCVQNFLMQNMEEIHRIVVFLDMHYVSWDCMVM